MPTASTVQDLPEVSAPSTMVLRRSAENFMAHTASSLELMPWPFKSPLESVVRFSASTRLARTAREVCDEGLSMLDRGLARSCKFVLKDQIAGTGANLREKSATISNLGNKLLEVQAERILLSNQVCRPHSWI